MRVKGVILSLVSLGLIAAGMVLIAVFLLGPDVRGNLSSDEPQGFNVPVLEDNQASGKGEEPGEASGPEDKTLRITIPKMTRIFDAEVPNATGNDEAKLKDHAAIHLEGSGFPWEAGANVYIAGHRLGYLGYPSFLAFYDLDELEKGDKITVTDADGKEYTYKVFRELIVSPTDLSVVEPVEGKDILTLQTCTLPDYSERVIVQAEKEV